MHEPKSIAVVGLLLTSLAGGVFYMAAERSGEGLLIALQLAAVLVSYAMVFKWLRCDELQFGYRRSAWFNIGIVALAFVFLSLYFARSRAAGSRLPSALASLGLMAFYYGLTWTGYFLGRAVT